MGTSNLFLFDKNVDTEKVIKLANIFDQLFPVENAIFIGDGINANDFKVFESFYAIFITNHGYEDYKVKFNSIDEYGEFCKQEIYDMIRDIKILMKQPDYKQKLKLFLKRYLPIEQEYSELLSKSDWCGDEFLKIAEDKSLSDLEKDEKYIEVSRDWHRQQENLVHSSEFKSKQDELNRIIKEHRLLNASRYFDEEIMKFQAKSINLAEHKECFEKFIEFVAEIFKCYDKIHILNTKNRDNWRPNTPIHILEVKTIKLSDLKIEDTLFLPHNTLLTITK